MPIWITGETPVLAVRSGRRRTAGGLPPRRLVLIDFAAGDSGAGDFAAGDFAAGDFGAGDFGGRQWIGVRRVDGLALPAGNA